MAHHYPSSLFLGSLLVLLFCLISSNFVHSHDIQDDNCQNNHQSSPATTSSSPHTSSSSPATSSSSPATTSSSPATSSSSQATSSSSPPTSSSQATSSSSSQATSSSPATSSSSRPTSSPPTSSSSRPTSSSSQTTSSTVTVTVTSISDLCQKHPNPNFCLELLKSKKDLKLPFIGQFAVAESTKCASNTKGLINVLIHQTKDIDMRHHLETCLNCYNDALPNLLMAAKNLDQGNMRAVTANVLEITKSIVECKNSIPPGAASVLQKKIEEMLQITSIVKIFATCHIPVGPIHPI